MDNEDSALSWILERKINDDTVCDAEAIQNITRLLALAKASGIELSANRYTQSQQNNLVDIKPKVS